MINQNDKLFDFLKKSIKKIKKSQKKWKNEKNKKVITNPNNLLHISKIKRLKNEK